MEDDGQNRPPPTRKRTYFAWAAPDSQERMPYSSRRRLEAEEFVTRSQVPQIKIKHWKTVTFKAIWGLYDGNFSCLQNEDQGEQSASLASSDTQVEGPIDLEIDFAGRTDPANHHEHSFSSEVRN